MKKELFILFLFMSSCVSKETVRREVIDNSARGGDLPEWVSKTQVRWDEGSDIFFKSAYTIQGQQRISGCYDLAQLELKERVLSELSQEVKGELNLANEGMSEQLDPLITKSIQTNFKGQIKGLVLRDQVYERYLLQDTERVECFIKSSISSADYKNLKNSLYNQLSSVNPQVAEAVRKRQSDFFKD